MNEPVPFRAYGENAATFLIFQALATKEGAVRRVLLKHLKRFGDGKKFDWECDGEPEIWLFPNFGKSAGFGEPDALILFSDHAFWVEVETTIDCRRGTTALRDSLLQLWRFRLFQAAVARSPRKIKEGRRIVGATLDNNLHPRDAAVCLLGHGVLQKCRKRLRKAGERGHDHYVLFTVNKPRGEGAEGRGYKQALLAGLENLTAACLPNDETTRLLDPMPERLPPLAPKHCWYCYWKGDLEAKFNREPGAQLKLEESYVRIKRSR